MHRKHQCYVSAGLSAKNNWSEFGLGKDDFDEFHEGTFAIREPPANRGKPEACDGQGEPRPPRHRLGRRREDPQPDPFGTRQRTGIHIDYGYGWVTYQRTVCRILAERRRRKRPG